MDQATPETFIFPNLVNIISPVVLNIHTAALTRTQSGCSEDNVSKVGNFHNNNKSSTVLKFPPFYPQNETILLQ